MARTMASWASRHELLPAPRKSSIIAPDQIIATGLAMFWPLISGADDCGVAVRTGVESMPTTHAAASTAAPPTNSAVTPAASARIPPTPKAIGANPTTVSE